MKPWVVKIGGRLCEEATARARFAEACAALDRPLIVVHGGGVQVSDLQARLGLVPRFIDGRRVTSREDVELVEMALSGAVNKALVRAFLETGRRAVGISGCDSALVRCARISELGEVGAPEVVDPAVLNALLQAGCLAIVSPVSLGPDGLPLNVNADELACAIAAAVQAERLYLVSDVPGVRADGRVIDVIEASDVEALIARGVANGGMIPKLRAAVTALRDGVGEVRITGFAGDRFDPASGTAIMAGERAPEARRDGDAMTRERTFQIRAARLADIDALEPFIAAYTGDGTLLPRSRENLAQHIRDFRVACDRDELIGCGALQIVEEGLAEVRTVVVTPAWRGYGVGHRIMEALVGDARRLHVSRLFCLTRQVPFFERHGFAIVPKERFPHKIWNDCRACPRRFACDEVAMEFVVPARRVRGATILRPLRIELAGVTVAS